MRKNRSNEGIAGSTDETERGNNNKNRNSKEEK
jgi:hypothetical protein